MRRSVRVVAALAVAVLMSGCGLLGDTPGPQEVANAGPNDPEVRTLKIGIQAVPDVAPIYWAMKQGYFREEHLGISDQDLITCPSGSACVAQLASKELDIALSSWTPFLLAIQGNVGDIRFVADACVLSPRNSLIMVPSGSPIQKVQDLAGKRIAVTAKGTASHLLTASALQVSGVDPKSIQWVETPFPQTAAAIRSGQVDAGFALEPYVQTAQRAGLLPIHDTDSGPTKNLPLSGYGILAETQAKYPKAVAAFQRALHRAVMDLQADRAKLELVLAEFMKITTVPVEPGKKPELAGGTVTLDVLKMASFNGFRPGNITPEGLGQVQDLMLSVPDGGLKGPLPGLTGRILPYPDPR